MATTYKIIRFFQRSDVERQKIVGGLTLEQAQAHCSDPESSSSTCTTTEGLDRKERLGAWFDGYQAED